MPTEAPGSNGSGSGGNGTLAVPVAGTHLECVSTGMDVMCMMEPDEPGVAQQLQQPAEEAAEAAPATPWEQLLSAAFLIAPFFLWGTTMAAMRVRGGLRSRRRFAADGAGAGSSGGEVEPTSCRRPSGSAACPVPPTHPCLHSHARRPGTPARNAPRRPCLAPRPAARLWGAPRAQPPPPAPSPSAVRPPAPVQPVTLHTTPLFMGSLRLLPGGLALVAWATAKGRPQPATPAAWAWVLAFALVDGAMFQVGGGRGGGGQPGGRRAWQLLAIQLAGIRL